MRLNVRDPELRLGVFALYGILPIQTASHGSQ